MTELPTGPESPGQPDSLPGIRMLHDRVLLRPEESAEERRSSAGIVIPATAVTGKRLKWATVVAVGQLVRQVETGYRVLYDPENKAEVEFSGTEYLLLRERDLHAVAEPESPGSGTGMYL